MGASGQRLELRLFLEGIEVPCVAASVQVGINAPATASIQVVPGDKILELKARTMVHLFFWDFTQDHGSPVDQESAIAALANARGITLGDAREIVRENPDLLDSHNELEGYKLMYSGEVIGVTLVKTPAGRQCVLQCSDFSTYWDTTYQFMVSYGPNGNFMGTSAAWWGAGEGFDDLGAGHVETMSSYLTRRPRTKGLEKVKGLMGGIIAMLEMMGGVPRHTRGINDFFTIAELKNHLLQQIVCEQNDDTSTRLFSNKAFGAWFNNSLGSLGQLCTFRDMIKLLFKYVYYEVVPNPAPMYVPTSAREKKSTKSVAKKLGEIEPYDAYQIQNVVQMAEYRARPTLNSDGRSPSRTAESAQLAAVKGPVTPATENARRARAARQLGAGEVGKGSEGKAAENASLPLRAVYSRLPARVRDPVNQALDTLKKIKSTSIKEEKIAGNLRADSAYMDKQRAMWKTVAQFLTTALKNAGQKVAYSKVPTKYVERETDRLHTQIFRPDCFFAAPPRCNVLFPDQYTQFQFSKNFLQEVTRLRLHIGWEFGLNEGLLETEYYAAPTMKDIIGNAKSQGNRGIRGLLPWEIYSGIMPKFETMHEVNYIAGRSEARLGIKTANLKGHAKSYGQRVANFNYMKYRFAARSCEVSARFNPFLVCGFPAAIIDRPFIVDPNVPEDREKLIKAIGDVKTTDRKIAVDDTSDYIREIAREFGAPSQYLGMIAGMSHNVDQSGGSTSFTLTHARTHRITDDDFLKIFSEELTREIETEIVATTLDAEDLIRRGDWTKLKLLIDATDQKLGERFEELDKRQENPLEDEEVGDDAPELMDRPDDTPDLEGVPDLAFGNLLRMPPPQREVSLTPRPAKDSPADRKTLRGETREAQLKHGRKTILEPVHPGVLQSGKKRGPSGGKVVQVQVHSDAAIMVTGIDLNKSVKVYKPVMVKVGPMEIFTGKKVRTKVTKDTEKNKIFLWRQVTIYEETPRKKKLSKTVPVEEAMRPAWFSPLYSNWFIGDQIYQPFFGTGSVVDQALFQAVSADERVSATFGTGRKQQQELLEKLGDADNDVMKITKILEDAKAKNISDVPDVESSIDALAYIYGEVRRLGLDVHKFVHDYTRRPIASMEDIFGSFDLEYKVDSSGNKLELVQGEPGFHSTAIDKVASSEGRLLGIIDNPDAPFPRINDAGKKSPISRALDPRPGRRKQVEEYLKEINAGSGRDLLGIGVQG